MGAPWEAASPTHQEFQVRVRPKSHKTNLDRPSGPCSVCFQGRAMQPKFLLTIKEICQAQSTAETWITGLVARTHRVWESFKPISKPHGLIRLPNAGTAESQRLLRFGSTSIWDCGSLCSSLRVGWAVNFKFILHF